MRLPPQNIEAEESLLASILLNDKWFKDCEYLHENDFYKTDHRIIFESMKDLNRKQERIDLVTLGANLKLKDHDLAGRLTAIADNAAIAMNPKAYAKIIKDNATKRDLLNTVSAINEKIYTDDVTTILDFAQSKILGYKVTRGQGKIYNIKDLVHGQIDKIEKSQTQENTGGVSLGFTSLDKWVSMQDGVYSVIAGRPSMGKTAFALTIIRNMALRGGKPGIISLEMGRGKLLNRWLSMLTGINTMNFNRYNGLSQKDWQTLKDAANEIYELWDVLITDAPARTIEVVERQARQMVADGATSIFIDQLSHIGSTTDDDVKNYTKHSNRIASLKKELNIPIFLLAQLNRKVEDRSDKEPKLSDLKMTGSLEEDADIVFLLYRPEYYEKEAEAKKQKARDVVINIAKNRDGVTYRETDVIVFDKGRTLFEEDFSRLQYR